MILKNPRNLMWLLPLALFLTSPLWKPGLASFLKPRGGYGYQPVVGGEEKASQNFIMDTITITMSDRGRVDWVINAEKAFTGQSDKEIGMKGVDALYTDKNGIKTLINSSRGMYDVDERHLILEDNVVIRKPGAGQEMFTDLLHYYDDRKTAVSPGDVEIKGPNYKIDAGRMRYDLATDSYDFSKGVKVNL